MITTRRIRSLSIGLVMVGLSLLGHLALAQTVLQVSSDDVPELPPGFVITILDPNFDSAYALAEELYVSPTALSAAIPHDGTTTFLTLTVSSKISTEFVIVTDHPELLVSGDTVVRIRAGNRLSISFTAYAPHSGVIELQNILGEVIASIPYEVTEARSYRQNVSATVSVTGSVSASYGIRFDNNVSVNVNLGANFFQGTYSGSISGSYSW